MTGNEQTCELTDLLMGMVNEHCSVPARMLWAGRKQRTIQAFAWLEQEGYLEPVPGRPDLYRWTAKALGN
jgi:hypothetical protein